jgi:hypothetical protein
VSENEQVVNVTPELSGTVSKAEAWAAGLTIGTPEEYGAALDVVKRFKAVRANVVAFFADSKSKAHAAWKAVVASESAFTDKIDAAEKVAKAKLVAYQQAEEAKRMAEQRRLQAIADEAARKEREKIEAQARAAREKEEAALAAEAAAIKAEAKAESAEAVQAAPAVIVESRIASAGQSTRKAWKARLVSLEALTGIPAGDIRLTFLSFDEGAANKFAGATKGMVKVAGVEWVEESVMSIRRNG